MQTTDINGGARTVAGLGVGSCYRLGVRRTTHCAICQPPHLTLTRMPSGRNPRLEHEHTELSRAPRSGRVVNIPFCVHNGCSLWYGWLAPNDELGCGGVD